MEPNPTLLRSVDLTSIGLSDYPPTNWHRYGKSMASQLSWSNTWWLFHIHVSQMEGIGDTQHWHPSQLVPLSVLPSDRGSCHAYWLPLQVWASKRGDFLRERSPRMKGDCVRQFFPKLRWLHEFSLDKQPEFFLVAPMRFKKENIFCYHQPATLSMNPAADNWEDWRDDWWKDANHGQ